VTGDIQNSISIAVPFSLIPGVASVVEILITGDSGSSASAPPPNEVQAQYVFSNV